MKKVIPFLTGFLCAILLISTTPIKAATGYINAYFNNDQKVTVNGIEKKIQFLNASDTNYGKIRDIVSAMGGTTNYDETTQTIEILTNETSITATPIPIIKAPEIVQPSPNVNSDGSLQVVGKTEYNTPIIEYGDPPTKYIYFSDTFQYRGPGEYEDIKKTNIKYHDDEPDAYDIIERKTSRVLFTISNPLRIAGKAVIEYNYYIETIYPVIKGLE